MRITVLVVLVTVFLYPQNSESQCIKGQREGESYLPLVWYPSQPAHSLNSHRRQWIFSSCSSLTTLWLGLSPRLPLKPIISGEEA
ncbi:hypothetical protein DFH94DRAFT_719023 [Russula ochroleuca]|uniref:Secreted protein n=1 Tax=Russula ochroleuca TaxID=152965 RepID=A0A9P5N395_9AGAM|nr:hypothetical protein DFH94DRAFT_719023 [Russula ochroleuca]